MANRYTKIIKSPPESEICAAILSAGIGKKIRSNEPRSLLKIGPSTLVDHQIKMIDNAFRSSDILLVVGIGSEKIIRKTERRIRIIENQMYESTNTFESLRLSVINNTKANILFMHGDLYFNQQTLSSMRYDKSFLIVDTKNRISTSEVGITVVNDKATTLAYDLPTKWAQIAFLTGKEYEILESIFLKSSSAHKKMLSFEIINSIIERGGSFVCLEPEDMQLLEIDSMKDISYENFNIQ